MGKNDIFYVSLKQKLTMEIKNLEFRVFKQIFKTEKSWTKKNIEASRNLSKNQTFLLITWLAYAYFHAISSFKWFWELWSIYRKKCAD